MIPSDVTRLETLRQASRADSAAVVCLEKKGDAMGLLENVIKELEKRLPKEASEALKVAGPQYIELGQWYIQQQQALWAKGKADFANLEELRREYEAKRQVIHDSAEWATSAPVSKLTQG